MTGEFYLIHPREAGSSHINVSTLYGEKTVLRLLNISEALHSFSALGFENECEEKFNSMLIEKESF